MNTPRTSVRSRHRLDPGFRGYSLRVVIMINLYLGAVCCKGEASAIFTIGRHRLGLRMLRPYQAFFNTLPSTLLADLSRFGYNPVVLREHQELAVRLGDMTC